MAVTREASRVASPAPGDSEPPFGKLAPGPGRTASEVAAHQCTRIRHAMIKLVAERGYAAVKVRDLVEMAGVSTRAFYEHFDGKEDCFLRTHDRVTRRATRHIIAAQANERNWRERPRLILDEFLRGVEEHPHVARFALIEAYEAGPAAFEQARRAENAFEGMLSECFGRAPGGVAVSPLIVEAMVAGVRQVTRARLLADRVAGLRDLSDHLLEWVLCYPGQFAAVLSELDRQSVWRNTAFESPSNLRTGEESGAWASAGDRSVILSAATELAAGNGYSKLTVARIRSRAGVSRVTFNSHFDGAESCLLGALEQRAGEVFAEAARAQAAGHTWAGGIYRATVALCDQFASDTLLARVCLSEDFVPGPRGRRFRQRLITSVVEQLTEYIPSEFQAQGIAKEASAGAVWTLFHRHILGNRMQRAQIAASLSYLLLTPAISAASAVAAIQREQAAEL